MMCWPRLVCHRPVTFQVCLLSQSTAILGDSCATSPADELAIAQVALSSSIVSNVSSWLNTSGGSGCPSSFTVSQVLSSVAVAQLQLSTLDCASLSCGLGVCVVESYIPTCNCSGTGFSGAHCEMNQSVSGGSGVCLCVSAHVIPLVKLLVWRYYHAGTLTRLCPSLDTSNCSSHGTCVPNCVGDSCTPYCRFRNVGYTL